MVTSLARLLTRSDAIVASAAVTFDALNRMLYGVGAPRVAELVWVERNQIVNRLSEAVDYRYSKSGLVVTGPWPYGEEEPVHQNMRSQAILLRLREGLSWEDAGYLDIVMGRIGSGLYDQGDRALRDVVSRCNRLDRVFEQVSRERRLRTQKELRSRAFRELGGVQVSINQSGELVKTGGGNHRLAMAEAVGIEVIPAMVGVVHIDALWQLDRLRVRD